MIEHSVRTMSGMVSSPETIVHHTLWTYLNLCTDSGLEPGWLAPRGAWLFNLKLKSLGAEADDLDILLRSVKRHVRLPRDNVIREADTRDRR